MIRLIFLNYRRGRILASGRLFDRLKSDFTAASSHAFINANVVVATTAS
jgi:hypothetical protein